MSGCLPHGAGGLGYLLAQQLVATGERVVDVQPTLAARVRLLATGSSKRNDPSDARSVDVAALHSTVPEVRVEDHVKVMKVWAKRRRDLSSHRTRIACRLHAVVCELTPGGFSREISAGQATRLLDELEPVGAVAAARHAVACEFVADLRRIDGPAGRDKQRIAPPSRHPTRRSLIWSASVRTLPPRSSATSPRVAAAPPNRDHFAAYNGTAPIEVSSGERPRKVFRLSRRGNRRLNHVIHMTALAQIRHRHSQGRAYYDRKIAEGHSGKEAIRALKRRISDAVYRQLHVDADRAGQHTTGPGGHTGNDSVASPAGSHPEHRLFGQATPEPDTTLRPARARTRQAQPSPTSRRPRQAS